MGTLSEILIKVIAIGLKIEVCAPQSKRGAPLEKQQCKPRKQTNTATAEYDHQQICTRPVTTFIIRLMQYICHSFISHILHLLLLPLFRDYPLCTAYSL